MIDDFYWKYNESDQAFRLNIQKISEKMLLMEELAFRTLVIIELRKQGYIVIEPGSDENE